LRAEPADLPDLSNRRAIVVNWRDPGHHLAGGSERYAWEFALALKHAGASVEFLTSRDKGQSSRSVVDGIRVRRAGGRFSVYPWTLALLWRRRRRVDVLVDVENGIPSFAPIVVPRVPILLVMHHVHLDQFGTHFPWPMALLGRLLEGKLMPWVYRRSHAIAVSDSTRDEMVHRLGWRQQVDVVFNGTDALPAVHSRPDPRRVAVLGRLVAHKRVDEVIRAAALLRDRGRPIQVDVIGRGPEEAGLRDLVNELGLADDVLLHGFVDESTKADLLSRARLHVCASEGEGWGLVVLETAAVGLPTVAYDVPGLRDSVVDGETGWLLSGDRRLMDGIDEALEQLTRPEVGAAMTAACRARAGQYTWQTMHERSARVVASLVEG
jgi:glycosyltransferase involved in cell wall biosynthesis